MDMHAPSIAYAQRNFACQSLMFRCASGETLHDDPSKWDAIVLVHVLESTLKIRMPCYPVAASYWHLVVKCWWLCRMAELRLTDLVVAVLNKYVFRGLWTRAIQSLP